MSNKPNYDIRTDATVLPEEGWRVVIHGPGQVDILIADKGRFNLADCIDAAMMIRSVLQKFEFAIAESSDVLYGPTNGLVH